MAAAKLGIEAGQKLHAKYAADGEFYPAVVVDVSSAKNRSKKPVKITYNGYPEEVWVSIDTLKSKALGLKPAAEPAPKAKAKAKADKSPEPKGTAKAKAKGKAKPEKIQVKGYAKVKKSGLTALVSHTNGHAFKVAGKWFLAEELVKSTKADAKAYEAEAKKKAKAAEEKAAKKAKDAEKKKRDPVKFTYFGLWAKGPAIALALEHSGIEWVGEFPQDWKGQKPTTPWLELPVLEIPGTGSIGHEVAILNYVGKRSKKMEGYSMADYMTSQQLVQEAEDIYKTLGKIKQGAKTDAEVQDFWNKDDPTSGNQNFGIKVYLGLLEKFYTKCGLGDGKYTKSGITVGECKLFTMLHACKMIKGDVLDGFAGVKAFYDRFAALERTKAILDGTGKMPGVFKQYFEK